MRWWPRQALGCTPRGTASLLHSWRVGQQGARPFSHAHRLLPLRAPMQIEWPKGWESEKLPLNDTAVVSGRGQGGRDCGCRGK